MPIDLTRYSLFAKGYRLTLLANQGYCNSNYIAQTDKDTYLVRHFKLQNIDRAFEFSIQKKAHTKGLAPKPLLLDTEQNLMVTEFATGEHKFTLNKKELRELALTLRKLHKVRVRKKPHNHKKDFKYKHKKANATLLKLKKYKRDLVLCHHDLNPRNIFFTKKVTLVDWEFAGVNDKYFDLATVCVEFKLSREIEQYFLRCYASIHSREKLELYKVLYRELYMVWMGENITY
ncbi:MAG: phosphotransferase family protein [Epsilonproteobacteria bacterium]|nr:phosphotransferase family protein [Campylobacterota bacterium]